MSKFKAIKESFEKGNINKSTYSCIINDILLIDEQNRYWSIGMNTFKWYRLQNGKWIIDQPPNDLQIKCRSSQYLKF